MATYSGSRFENTTIVLDGNEYIDCEFVNCDLHFDGGELPIIRGDDTSIPGCRLTLGDTPARSLEFLSSLIRLELNDNFSQFFRRFAEKILAQIGSAAETESELELAPTDQLIAGLIKRQSFVGMVLAFDMPLEKLRRFWQQNPNLPQEGQPKIRLDLSESLKNERAPAILRWVAECLENELG